MANRMALQELETYLQSAARIVFMPDRGGDVARLVMSLPENVPHKIVQACNDWSIPFELGKWEKMPD